MIFMDVIVCKKTLVQLENYLDQLKLDIIHQIGQNYLSKTDYKELVTLYSDDLLMDMIRIIRYDIFVKIHKKYLNKCISFKEFINECSV